MRIAQVRPVEDREHVYEEDDGHQTPVQFADVGVLFFLSRSDGVLYLEAFRLLNLVELRFAQPRIQRTGRRHIASIYRQDPVQSAHVPKPRDLGYMLNK